MAHQLHVTIEKNMMVSMRDGVRLATDVYRSANETGKVPAILLRTLYDKGAAERTAMAMRWADAGHACVV